MSDKNEKKFYNFLIRKKYFYIKFQKSGEPILRGYVCEDLCQFSAKSQKI